MNFFKPLALIVPLTLSIQAHGASFLPLDVFLSQVNKDNKTVAGSQLSSEGAKLRSQEGDDLFAPTFFTDAQFYSDQRVTNNPAFMGTKTEVNTYSLGLSKLTPYGSRLKLSYNINYTALTGVNSLFVPISQFHDAYPKLEVNQSLWGNGFGAASRAQRDLTEASALSAHFAEAFRQKNTIVAAEVSYWNLAAARKIVLVQAGTLDRAVKIRSWSANRARLQLADRSDLLQAEAALQIRNLDLISAKNDARTAAMAFNLSRGIDSDEVSEDLDDMKTEDVLALSAPQQAGERDDIKEAQERTRIAAAAAVIDQEKTKPTVDVFGSYALNGRDPNLNGVVSKSFESDHPVWVAGVHFSMPLDFNLRSDIREGRLREKMGTELLLDRKRFELKETWSDLLKRFEETKKRLQLAATIETAQKEKLIYEKARLDRGRTTTYQVLLFEQDYAQSQLSLIQLKNSVLQLAAQMKLFNNAPQSPTGDRGVAQ